MLTRWHSRAYIASRSPVCCTGVVGAKIVTAIASNVCRCSLGDVRNVISDSERRTSARFIAHNHASLVIKHSSREHARSRTNVSASTAIEHTRRVMLCGLIAQWHAALLDKEQIDMIATASIASAHKSKPCACERVLPTRIKCGYRDASVFS